LYKPWNNWDLNAWLHHLEFRHAQEIQLGLARISAVAKKLRVTHFDAKIITVAGTNGKGSTVAALEALYHTAGYRVGAYTSPHLIRFNERIRVNLDLISDQSLCRIFAHIEENREDIHLTYFETITLAALLYFQEQKLNVILLEAGLGGRLDATNIIDTDLAVITTIDFDHQELLGNTLEHIGYEKAGILRKGKFFIYADANPPLSIINVVEELEVNALYYDKDYSITEQGGEWSVYWANKAFKNITRPTIQLKSAAAAIIATGLLQSDLPIAPDTIEQAMRQVFIPGRLQFLQNKVSFFYDVSHNAQSARLLADTIRKILKKKSVHAVFSALKDKDIFNLISPLKDCVDHWYPAQLNNKRAASSDKLLATFKDAEIFPDICYNSPLVAFDMAVSQAKAGDLIVVYGSFYTVGQIMTARHNIERKEIQ